MKNNKIKLMLLLVVVFLLIDQLSKILVLNFNDISFGILKIEVVYNTGIAFGMGASNLYNAILVFLVICVIVNFAYNQRDKLNNKPIIVLSMIISGGVGNLIDRIFRGGVLDFIKIANFPIFNLADSFIVIGWILLIFNLLGFFVKDFYSIKENK